MLSELKLYFILWGIFILQYLKSYGLRCNCIHSGKFGYVQICVFPLSPSWYVVEGGGIFCLFSPSHLPAASSLMSPP